MTERRLGIVILVARLILFAISLLLLAGMCATKSHTVLKFLRIAEVSAFDRTSCALLFYGVVRILVVAHAQSRQVCAIELQFQRSTSRHSRNQHTVTEPLTSRRRKKNNTTPFVIALVFFFLGCYVAVNYLVLCMALSWHQLSDDTPQILICLFVSCELCSESFFTRN